VSGQRRKNWNPTAYIGDARAVVRAISRASCRWPVAAALAVIVLCPLSQQVRAAAADSVELTWDASEACSSVADVLRSIDAQLGPDFASDTKLRAQGTMSVSAEGEYVLDLRYSSGAGAFDARRIRGDSCETVTRAAALVLAIALNPAAVTREPPPAEPVPDTEERQPPAFSMAALALFDTPVLGVPAAGAGGRAAFRLGGLELNASVHWFFPRVRSKDDVGLRLQYWSIGLGACYLWRVSSWGLGPCATFEMGPLSGEPRGEVDAPKAGSARVHAATLGGALRVPLWAALGLVFDAGFEWVERRPQFHIEMGEKIASSSVFGARSSLGLAWTY
jgi:hypothetical protein